MNGAGEPQGGTGQALDRVFHARADPTRRRILAILLPGPARVTDLARPFRMSLPAVSKHLKVLEEAGLVSPVVEGRVHRLTLRGDGLDTIDAWLRTFRAGSRPAEGATGPSPPAGRTDPS